MSKVQANYDDLERVSQLTTNIKGEYDGIKSSIDSAKNTLSDQSIFAGPAADSLVEAFSTYTENLDSIITGFETGSAEALTSLETYKAGDSSNANNLMQATQFKSISPSGSSGAIAYTTQIPGNVSQSGYLITGYSSRGFEYTGGEYAKAEGTASHKAVHDAYVADGGRYKNGVCVMNVDGQERYLVAVSPTYGKVGDKIDVHLENGQTIPCVIADAKSTKDSNYTEWGHRQSNGSINVLEFEVDMNTYKSKGNPTTSGWGLEWDSSSDVTSVDNYGSIINS